jgi:tRNA dimethylallyltransferase
MSAPLPPCLCLAGPTAAGKTAAALAIAQALDAPGAARRGVEIISVDSALVYRGMDIGTAKPSAAEQAQVPHHLIDIIEPTDSYSAAAFAQDARRLMAEIAARGRWPLLVGGTMLYFKALFEGLDAMPAADPGVRAQLGLQLRQEGLSALYQELVRVDPVTAQRLAPGDSQRIQRALEVHRVSGRALSSFHRATEAPPSNPPPPCLSLEPAERAWLHQRIHARLSQMLAQGLVEEVRVLRQRGDLHAELPSMRCVGYRQTWEALDAGGVLDLDTLAERCSAATRQLAKRQLTWLRQWPERQVVACDAPDATAQAVAWARAQAARLSSSPAL